MSGGRLGYEMYTEPSVPPRPWCASGHQGGILRGLARSDGRTDGRVDRLVEPESTESHNDHRLHSNSFRRGVWIPGSSLTSGSKALLFKNWKVYQKKPLLSRGLLYYLSIYSKLWVIYAAFGKGVTAKNPPYSFGCSFYKSILLYSLVPIHATTWGKWTIPIRKQFFVWSMVRRESGLVETNEFEGYLLWKRCYFHIKSLLRRRAAVRSCAIFGYSTPTISFLAITSTKKPGAIFLSKSNSRITSRI